MEFIRSRIEFYCQKALIGVAVVLLFACGGQQNTADTVFPMHAIAGASQLAAVNISAPTFGPRSNYTITKTSTGYTVTDAVGGTGTQTFSLTTTQIVFSDMTVNLGIGDKSQTISSANLQSLIELYIAYFNRVPDADGLSYWIDQLVAGQSIDQIGTSFYNAAIQYSGLTGYSSSMSNSDFITLIYKNVLGRTSVDSSGMNYWLQGLANGSQTRGTLVRTILGSAHTFKGDATYGYVADLLDNKVKFANSFTIQQGLNYNTPQDSITNTMAMVAAITPASTASATAMLGNVDWNFAEVKNPAFPTPTNPVAIASPVYAIGPYVMLDGSKSYDPQGKSLTYNWTIPTPPVGWQTIWGGLVDKTTKGTAAFYTYQGEENFRGTFNAVLTVSNGVESSPPITIPINICCSPTALVAKAVDFTSKLPKYSIAQAKNLYSNYASKDWASDFIFAASYGFSYPQLDYLKGIKAGTSVGEMRNNGGKYTPSNGGAVINGYSLNIDNAIEVPVDLKSIKYPEDYLVSKSKSVTIFDPYCNNSPDSTTFMASDLGGYPMPTINTSPLPSSTLKIANIKDIWDVMNPSIGESCQKDVSVSWNTTFDRLTTMGVNAIAITPWTFFMSTKNGWTLPVAGTSPRVSQMTDENVKWIVGLAKARGLKVYWVNQIQAVINPDGSYFDNSTTTATDVNKAVQALKPYLAERGKFLQSIGVDGVILGSWYWVNFGTYLGTDAFAAANLEMINSLKKSFSGDIVYSPSGVGDITESLNSVVNKYIYSTYVGFDNSSIAGYSVGSVKSQYMQSISLYQQASSGKPLIFEASIQSRAGYFTYKQGYFDPFCTSSGSNPCVQNTLSGDFSLQAIFTEAVLEVAASMGQGLSGIVMPYFVDPNLLPPQSFYNQDATVRGKPSEYIFYKWFSGK